MQIIDLDMQKKKKLKKKKANNFNHFLSPKFKHVLGAQKNRLIETVLLSTHNICFWLRNKKNSFQLPTLIWKLKNNLISDYPHLNLSTSPYSHTAYNIFRTGNLWDWG